MTETAPERQKRSADSIGVDPFQDMEPLIEAAASTQAVEPDVSALIPERVVRKSTVARLHPDTGVSMVACPYLGIFDDANTRFLEPEPAHHCYAGRRSRPIMLAYQQEYCLAPSYHSCEIYVSTRANTSPAKPAQTKPKRPGFWKRLFRKNR